DPFVASRIAGRLPALDAPGHAARGRRRAAQPSGVHTAADAGGGGASVRARVVRRHTEHPRDRAADASASSVAASRCRCRGGGRRRGARGLRALTAMALYRIGPMLLDSAIPLPELTRADRRSAAEAWTFRPSRRRPPSARAADWFHEWRFPSGKPWVRLGRLGARYVVRFHRTALFLVDPPNRAVVAFPSIAVPAPTRPHLLLA